MRVIKKNPWSKEVKCTGRRGRGWWLEELPYRRGCGAILLVTEHDVYKIYYDDYPEVGCYCYFCCPECGAETEIRGCPNPLGERPSEEERERRRKRKNT